MAKTKNLNLEFFGFGRTSRAPRARRRQAIAKLTTEEKRPDLTAPQKHQAVIKRQVGDR